MKDAKYQTLREKTLPTAFVAIGQDSGSVLGGTIELRIPSGAAAAAARVRSAIAAIDPRMSMTVTTFATQVVNVKPQHRILLEKFALEELKLIAIIGGNGTQPRAMFVDPTGTGVTVVRGDHVSKVDALVTRVAPDRVFFQLEEDLGAGGKPKLTERVVELHAGENVGQ